MTIFASGFDEARASVNPSSTRSGSARSGSGRSGPARDCKSSIIRGGAAEAVSASVALLAGLGLDVGMLVDALEGGLLVSAWQAAKLQRILDDDFSAQFALSLALKDVLLALEADETASLRLAVWPTNEGLGDQDLTVVTRALARLTR